MEGTGSRLGRASSRYCPATTVLNGPVRRWKKMWVHASSSSVLKYQSTHSQSNAHKLLLCRWTPVPTSSPASAADSDAVDTAPEEPPRRKFRYTPITVVEEQKNAAIKKVDDEGKRRLGVATMAEEVQEKPNMNLVFEEETMDSGKRLYSLDDANHSDLDLGLCLNRKLGKVG